ncbi:MAG: hypothetical protein ACTSPQ_10060 [Candidatus Helarchaeota archaeon]
MLCKRCGAITFGGYCPVCKINDIRLGLTDFPGTFPRIEWIEDKIKYIKGQKIPDSISVENPQLHLNHNSNYDQMSKNLESLKIQKNGIFNLIDHVNMIQKRINDWINKIDEDSGFIKDISHFIKLEREDKKNLDIKKKESIK